MFTRLIGQARKSISGLYYNTSQYLSRHTKMQFLVVVAFFFLVFFVVYFSVQTVSSSDDHYFHFRFAEQMVHDGFFQTFYNFSAISLSKMAHGGEYFVYYNFLFYLVVIPFTFIQPLFLGIKLYAVCIIALAFTLLFYCLRKVDIKNPFIWSIILVALTNTGSIWRFFLSRPYALAPSLLLLLLVFLYRRNRIGVFTVSFLYLFWHSATFYLPLCVSLGYYLIERFYHHRGDRQLLAYSALGTVVALGLAYIISPGFLDYMREIIFGTYIETIIGKKVMIGEGGELYPTDFFNFIQGNALIFASFIAVLFADLFAYISYRSKKIDEREYSAGLSPTRRVLQMTVLILTALFFLGTVSVSGRFGDYFTFFAGFYIALSVDYIRRVIVISGPAMIRRGVYVGLSIVLCYLFVSNLLFLQNRIAYGSSTMEFYQVGSWLDRNAKVGDTVYIANWSWFPGLYYYSPHTNYTTGLEPRFSYVYDPKLYWLSVHIAQNGYICDQEKCPDIRNKADGALSRRESGMAWAKTEGDSMADVIKDQIHARYIVTSSPYQTFNFILDHNDSFKLILRDKWSDFSLYEVQ